MRYLFLVHCENMFQEYMDNKFHFDLAQAIFEKDYDKIVVLCSEVEADRFTNGLLPIVQFMIDTRLAEYVQWGWGYEKDESYDDEEDGSWIIESSGHEYTWIPKELRNLTNEDSAILCGGCEGECLADFESIMSELNVPYIVSAYY